MRISDWSSDVCSSDLIPVCIGEYVGADVRGAFDKGSDGANVLRPAHAHSTDDISIAHADRSEVIGVQVSSNNHGVVRAWPTSYLNVAAELVRPTPWDGFEGFFLPDDGLGNCDCVVLRSVPVLTTVHAAAKPVGHVGHIADRVHINDGGPEVSVDRTPVVHRSEAHTSELQSLMRISYAV